MSVCAYDLPSKEVKLARQSRVHSNKEESTPYKQPEHGTVVRRRGRPPGPGRKRPTVPGSVSKATKSYAPRHRIMLTSTSHRRAMKCPKCPSKFSGTGNLTIHIMQHGRTDKKMRCPHCDYASNRDDYMRAHVDVHNVLVSSDSETPADGGLDVASPRPSTSNASKPTSRKLQLPANLTEKDKSKMLRGNPRIVYIKKSTDGLPLPLASSFKCWHCPYATLKYSSYVDHKEGHGAKAKYVCSECNYSCKTSKRRKNHLFVHLVVNPTTKHSHAHLKAAEEPETPEQEAPFYQSPPRTPPPPVTGDEETERMEIEPEAFPSEFFISNIKITNMMKMNEEPMVVDLSTLGILKLKGRTEEGKSAFILAIMLGMGYDLCLGYTNSHSTICGLNLKNIISEGEAFATIELTLSLRSFPALQKEFGSQLKFSRRINRTQSEDPNFLVVDSADPRPQFKSVPPKELGGKDLKEFLEKLKLSPDIMRLMLLDGENVKYLMNNTHLWFGFLEAAVDDSAVEINGRVKESKFLLQRLEAEQKLQQELLEVFKSRLQEIPPLDSEKIRQLKKEDLKNHNKCTEEINQLAKEKRTLQKQLGEFVVQAKNGTEAHLLRMRTMFNKFLYELNYAGEVMVSHQTKELSICIWKIDSPDVPPGTMDRVKHIWKSMSNGRRRIAVIGLYLALWEISNYLGILAADAYSCTEADFQVPPSGLPILWELLNRKCLEQKQCIISLPQDY